MAVRIWNMLRVRVQKALWGQQAGVEGDEACALRREGEALLTRMLGPRATFRAGQWDAIEAVVLRGERVLVVQRTGWGKSLVYFLATRLLRERGAGPTLLVSPLLSLMRNQIAAAERIGVRAYTINSENRDEWRAVEHALANGQCDILLVSPERLGSSRFQSQMLGRWQGTVGMLAVDEAHCISDWGHDFRPDYRRIARVLRRLPPTTAVLATTATANERVITDVSEQLGPDLCVYRGGLSRSSLCLQVIGPGDQATRLAWLADQLPRLTGTGIIYCLTVADCRRVSDWLLSRGIAAPPYYAALEEYRVEREALLLENRVKALVATVALGMGFDKPDLSFVIHYQLPASVVAYYQQVGRAGRSIDPATVVLLHGAEEREIHAALLRNDLPRLEELREVLAALERAGEWNRPSGLTESELLDRVNVSPGRMEQLLKLLQIDEMIARRGGRYYRTSREWRQDEERWRRLAERRQRELARMQAYPDGTGCLMQFLARELDDQSAAPCGRCDVCRGTHRPLQPPETLVREARAFLRTDYRVIEPRWQWPEGSLDGLTGRLPYPNEPGRALCLYGDAGWGPSITEGKYRIGRYSDALVEACAELVRGRWRPAPSPAWVTAIPSLRRPDLVPEFAARLARRLGLPYHGVLALSHATAEQKEMKNSAQQVRNLFHALRVAAPCPAGPVLLVDDIVDSRWTLTIAGHRLREADSGPVFPLALAEAAGRSGLS